MKKQREQAQSLVDVAYKSIKSDIETHKLKPGQKLITRELSERYKISQTPIKHALNRLMMEGLVDAIPNKGMSVKNITWRSFLETCEARRMIELFAIDAAISEQRSNGTLHTRLENILIQHQEVPRTDASIENFYRILELEKDFHQMFVQATQNKKIIHIYSTLGSDIYMYYYTFALGMEKRLSASIEEHQAICDGLLALDKEALQDAINSHIDNTIEHCKNHPIYYHSQHSDMDQ